MQQQTEQTYRPYFAPEEDIHNLPVLHKLSIKAERTSRVLIAMNNTFIATLYSKVSYFINHYDYFGQLIKSLPVKNLLAICMLGPENVCLLTDKIQGQLNMTIWNIGNNITFDVELGHELKSGKDIKHYLFYFKNTNLVCYCNSNKKQIKLIYYKLPLSASSEPFHIYCQPCQGVDLYPSQGNMHSMVIFLQNYKRKKYDYYSNSYGNKFLVYSLRKGLITRLKEFILPQFYTRDIVNWVNEQFHQKLQLGEEAMIRAAKRGHVYTQKKTIVVREVWELKPYVFYLRCQDPQYNILNQPQINQNHERAAPRFYTLFYNMAEDFIYISPLTKFIPDPHRIQFTHCLRNLDSVTEFRISNQFRQGVQYNLPIYYVDFETEQIRSRFDGQSDKHHINYKNMQYKYGQGKFQFSPENGGIALQYWYDYFTCKVNIKMMMSCPTWSGLKTISTFFMLQRMPYCDDDLLFYVADYVQDCYDQQKKKNREKIGMKSQNVSNQLIED